MSLNYLKEIIFDDSVLQHYSSGYDHPRIITERARLISASRHLWTDLNSIEIYNALYLFDTKPVASGSCFIVASNSWRGLRMFYARSG